MALNLSAKRKILPLLLVVGVSGFLFLRSDKITQQTYPSIGVSLKLTAISPENKTASFVFIIKNNSDQLISFEPNKLAMVTFNHHKFVVETEYIELTKNQEMSINFTVSLVDFSRDNTITVSAVSNEGTKCTTTLKVSA